MERLCEDELMCIQQYVPDSMVGVSNERLYDEIKLLDPTFSMMKLYYDLLRWREMLDGRIESEIWNTYHALEGCHILGMPGNDTIVVEEECLDHAMEVLEDLGWGPRVIDDGIEHRYTITMEHAFDYMNRELIDIEDTVRAHPLRNIRFRAGNYGDNSIGYDAEYHSHVEGIRYIPDHAYDEDLYTAIRALDRSINMNTLYNVYMGKYKRETAIWTLGPHTMSVRDMYKIWYDNDYLLDISNLTLSLTSKRMLITTKGATGMEILSGVPGWSHNGVSRWTYKGHDVDIVYDRILTMLRMYHSYSIPRTVVIGSYYYDL